MFNLNFSSKFIDKIILNLKCKRFTPEEIIFEVLFFFTFNFYFINFINFLKKNVYLIFLQKGDFMKKNLYILVKGTV